MLTMLPVDELLLAYRKYLREPSRFAGDELWLPMDELRLAYRDNLREPFGFAGDELWLPMDGLLGVRLGITMDRDLRRLSLLSSVEPRSSFCVGRETGWLFSDDEGRWAIEPIDAIRQRVVEL